MTTSSSIRWTSRLQQSSNRLLRALSSLTASSILLLYLFLLVAVMTFAQNTVPIFEASSRFIYSWIWYAGPIPLPAGRLVFLLIAINLSASLVTRFPFVWSRVGLIAAHLGLIVLVAGAMFGRPASAESVLALAEGEADSWSYDLRRWDVLVDPATDSPYERFPAERLPSERAVANEFVNDPWSLSW